MEANEFMLTTIDNPHNPHKDYNKWAQWDKDNGYDTSSYLARVANLSIDMENNKDTNEHITRAMFEIVMMDDTHHYTLI